MRPVIADTSPVILPVEVKDELGHPKAPFVVRNWIAAPPAWVDVRKTSRQDPSLNMLDAGEEAAISLAVELHADLLLMDDEEGVIAARGQGLEVTGTLGVLTRAAQRRLLDLREAFDRLKRTNFHYQKELLDQLLSEISGEV